MAVTDSKNTPAERLLDAASELFATEGIRAVGIDRLLASAGVARASLYHSFGSKEGLVLAYIAREDAADRAAYRRAAARRTDPIEKVLVAFELAERTTRRRGVFGCLYLNAAAEFADLTHPVNKAVREHRDWVRGQWTDALRDAGVRDSPEAATRVQLLYEGGVSGAQVTRSVEPIRRAMTMAEELLRGRWRT